VAVIGLVKKLSAAVLLPFGISILIATFAKLPAFELKKYSKPGI